MLGFKNIFDFFKSKESASAFAFDRSGGTYFNYRTYSYNGEKNLGEVGPIKNYVLDYYGLKARSWQALLESEVAHTIIYKYCVWVIGGGLKLTYDPDTEVLEEEGIKIDKQKMSKRVEQRFNLFKGSKDSDYSGMTTLDDQAYISFFNTIASGDVLCVLRYDGENPTLQLIDTAHVKSPMFGTEQFPQELPDGHQVIDGVEYDEKKRQVAFYICQYDGTYKRISAFGEKSKVQMAFLVTGLGYRIDNKRGIPLISAVLEKIKKLERYESAALAGAEERVKVPYQIVHNKDSKGENPMAGRLAKIMDASRGEDVPVTVDGKELASTVAATTNKSVFNMPINSELKALESKIELYYKDFYTTNLQGICAAIGMPYNVALSLYDSNYSASRAALKDWENSLKVIRKRFSDQFYQNIFNFWFEIQVLKGKIDAPGYFNALMKGNTDVINAYRKIRMIGTNVPYIDPLKEVNALRAALGDAGKDLPLTTLEEATELYNGSESRYNLPQFAKELADAKKLKIESVVPTQTNNGSNKPQDNEEEEED